ncbi:MAG: flippase-like protein [Conexibacter sp.]|nr:flippase-like protein [Conexibacter sp.]
MLLAALVLVALLAPGLGEVRTRLKDASPGWLALAVAFEVLSSLSYVVMFRPVFCSIMRWRSALQLGLSEVGTGSIIPASGAGGIALGAWVLSRAGMPAETIARRSIAFLLLKSSVNFAAVTVVGLLVFLGVLGPPQSVWLTLVPAVLAAAAIALVVLVGRLPAGPPPSADDGRLLRLWRSARAALVTGVAEAGVLLRRHDPLLIIGIVGYWAWDNLALWATFHAVGYTPGASVILLAYLIGQLGGLLPIPGGVGGIDGGLIGTFVVFGAPAAAATAAVLAYRIILFWIPLIMGAMAFFALRRSMARPGGFIPCAE